jgi:hypothetical protein
VFGRGFQARAAVSPSKRFATGIKRKRKGSSNTKRRFLNAQNDRAHSPSVSGLCTPEAKAEIDAPLLSFWVWRFTDCQVSATIELSRSGDMREVMCDGKVLVAIRERELIRVLKDWPQPFPGFFLHYPSITGAVGSSQPRCCDQYSTRVT